MKVLTKSENQGVVVELTHGEWKAFRKLAYAVEGKTQDDYHMELMRFDDVPSIGNIDFSGVFGSMFAYTQAKFRTNELQRLLDAMKSYLEGLPEEEKESG